MRQNSIEEFVDNGLCVPQRIFLDNQLRIHKGSEAVGARENEARKAGKKMEKRAESSRRQHDGLPEWTNYVL